MPSSRSRSRYRRWYLASGEYVWNSGMFCFRADVLLDTAKTTCPDVYAAALACYAARPATTVRWSSRANLPRPARHLHRLRRYGARLAPRRGASARFDWSDIGSWKAVERAGGNRTSREPRARPGHPIGRATATSRATAAWSPRGGRAGPGRGGHRRRRAGGQSRPRPAGQAGGRPSARRASRQRHSPPDRAPPWGSFTVLEDAPDAR